MSWIGLDIGGANLKASDGRGWARSIAFPLWRNPDGLAHALDGLVQSVPDATHLAVTMTGELCDCFESKAEGVRHILKAVEKVAGTRSVRVYLVEDRFVTVAEALERHQLAAASNWHALASFACRFLPASTGLLIDIGSTTTDIIPLFDRRVSAVGRNDTERLLSHELVYAGVGRTPICSLVRELPWRGERCPIAAEVFSTTADAYVLTGEVNEDSEADWTADGRPLTKAYARQRLARQLCADATDFRPDEFEQIASSLRDAQTEQLTRSVLAVATRMTARPQACILSGSGEFLVEAAVKHLWPDCELISLAGKVGQKASQCAPAHAVAILAAEKEPDARSVSDCRR